MISPRAAISTELFKTLKKGASDKRPHGLSTSTMKLTILSVGLLFLSTARAFWKEGTGDYKEKGMRFDTSLSKFIKDIKAEAALDPNSPAWMHGIPDFLPDYDDNAPEYVDFQANINNVPAKYRSPPLSLYFKRNNKGVGAVRDKLGTPVAGLYKGVAVTYDPRTTPAGAAQGSFLGLDQNGRAYTYAEALSRVAEYFKTEIPMPDGSRPTIMSLIGKFAQQRTAAGAPDLERSLENLQSSSYDYGIARWVDLERTTGPLDYESENTWSITIDANKIAAINSGWTATKDINHGKVLSSVTKIGATLWKAGNTWTKEKVDPFGPGCTNLRRRALRRSLVKRARTCMRELEVINDDTAGTTAAPHDVVKRVALERFRMIKALTGNPNILPRDTGEGVSSDPFDNTELDPNEIYDGASDLDEAMKLIDDSFSSILDQEPEKVDKSLSSKILKALKKETQMRIANNKGVRSVQMLVNRNKQITAESMKNSYNDLAMKYLNRMERPHEMDDDDDPPPTDPSGQDLNPQEVSVELSFYPEDYENPTVTEAVATADVLEIAADILPQMKPLDDAPTAEDGGETYIDPTHALPGTNEFSGLFRAMSGLVKETVDDPKVSKWKLVKIRAMLARNAKSLEARAASLKEKQESGKEITQKEVDEYEAVHAFHQSASDSLVGKDIDGMSETPEDVEKIKAISEYTPDPGAIIPSPTKVTVKAQKGKPTSWKSGVKIVANSSRKTRGVVTSKHGTPSGRPSA